MNPKEFLDAARTLASVAVFESGAFGYSFLTRAPAWREHCAHLVDLTEVTNGARVLDLGCGPGISAFAMLDRIPDLDVVGLDLSRAMLLAAEFWKKREPHGDRVSFQRADATFLPFPDASFDAVTGNSFLYIVPDPAKVLAEVRRVLKPGGRCVFLEPSTETFPMLVPTDILRRAPRELRFVLAMALWRFYSRTYGRFDELRFASLFQGADLTLLSSRRTLSGLAIFGVGEKRADDTTNGNATETRS